MGAASYGDKKEAIMGEVMTVAIVDDESAVRGALRDLLNHYASEHAMTFVIREYASGEALLAEYRSDADLILLDVEMGETDGLETARAIRNLDLDVLLLFITNMAQFAIRGYEGAMSYLLKPVNQLAFDREIGRCIATRREQARTDALTCTTKSGVMRIPLSNILYLECMKHKIIIHGFDVECEFTGTLKSYSEQLEPYGFCGVNSCYLVNLRYVMGLERNDCLLRDGTRLAVSRRRRSALLQSLAGYFSVLA